MTVQDNMATYGQFSADGVLVLRRWLPGPLDRIWRYLTDGEMRSKWLAAGDDASTAGAPLELIWRNDTLSRSDDPRPEGFSDEHRMQSEVIAIDPMRRLTISWGKGDVTFDLGERAGRVLLTLTHRGLTDPAGRAMIGAGWHMHLEILIAIATGQTPPSFWSGWQALQKVYAARG